WLNEYLKYESGDCEAYILRAKINAATGYYRLALNDLRDTLEMEKGGVYLQDSDWYHFENLVGFEEYQDFVKEVRS
ncbi:MAG: hypothetical protein OEZ36_13400, partial [Spirochaetota bacterium]|nr:hypothetical protein [Spirochaetota bacterium]